MIDYEGENEFLNEAENAQIRIASNLIERALLILVEKGQRLHSGEGFRHKRFGKIEPFVAADDVFNAPMNSVRCCQSRLKRISVVHFEYLLFTVYNRLHSASA